MQAKDDHDVGPEWPLPCLHFCPGEQEACFDHLVESQLNQQVSPLPVESSLPPINWDNIKAKCVSPFLFLSKQLFAHFSQLPMLGFFSGTQL